MILMNFWSGLGGTILRQAKVKGHVNDLGATVKRAADYGISRGKGIIQKPQDFYDWTQSDENTSDTSFFFVSSNDVAESY